MKLLNFRNGQTGKTGLRLRLTLLVSAELLVSIAVAWGLNILLRTLIPGFGEIPSVIIMFAISVIVGFFVTGALSRMFFSPIEKLGGAMEKVAEGDFSVRAETWSNAREIREIYDGFNLMAKELEATEILQSDFVSNVSHEFKTPINAIEGYSTLLQGGENLTPEQSEYVEKIILNTRRLSSLTGNILLLSKLENQSIPPEKNYFSLDEQIRQSIVESESVWDKKEIEFDAELDDVTFYGNEKLLRLVWDNLIGNAVKFSPMGGKITLKLKKRFGKIIFSVDDEGPGISPEAQRHIFNKFYQADPSHRQEGNGLGLSLVKKILLLEEGEISVQNKEKGCVFTVIFENRDENQQKLTNS